MQTKGEVIRSKLEFMLMMAQAGRDDMAQRALKDVLEICDSITEQMPEEAE